MADHAVAIAKLQDALRSERETLGVAAKKADRLYEEWKVEHDRASLAEQQIADIEETLGVLGVVDPADLPALPAPPPPPVPAPAPTTHHGHSPPEDFGWGGIGLYPW